MRCECGIPQMLREYDIHKMFEQNLNTFLEPDSAFIQFMPYLMDKYFRRPECYHHILCAIAHGKKESARLESIQDIPIISATIISLR